MSNGRALAYAERILCRSRPILGAVLAMALILPLAGCGAAKSASGPISVVSGIGQWASMARQLGGDKVDARPVIANPNADAHDYEPTTQDIALIGRADLVVVNGAGYDAWAGKAADAAEVMSVNVADSSGHKSGDNPHLWFSSQARAKAARAISLAYQELRPADKDYFSHRYKLWQEGERDLSERMEQAAVRIGGGGYAATESAADYLAQDLGLSDRTPAGYLRAAANESEPSPADIQEFNGVLSSSQVKLLVFNDQEANEISRQLVSAADRAGLPVVRVSEQMPARFVNLEDWIGDLADAFGRAAD
ncbi:metal ABC transporter solute-binding protein, Zn/Mn family [Bifidobacterium xylocopae]|uniref:ABC transporter substrate-binding protein n=1 Tax=Bifidobacterium xylocopae TaxID=2493119 RepID=A0A366KF72_9BIFI|nr:zinc ABC transporter substrate-binding protein [Bifidobacterium xylocopae]RBP99848.1 ABC transporter substrate-binding protein [Bifidobacterium xylocopae]